MQRATLGRRIWNSLWLLTCLVFIGMGLGLTGCGGSSAPLKVAVTTASTTVDATDSVKLTATVANDKNSAGVTWSVSGGGTLSGQSTSSATYTAPAASSSALAVTVTATSVADTSKTAPVSLTVPAAPSITTGSLTAATVGSAYSVTLAGSGGISPYTWSLTSGTLPASMTLSAAGVLTGTPMAADAGTLNLTFKLTDSGTATALTATKALSLTINPAPAISFTSASLAAATYNVAYTASVAAAGGAGSLTYSLASGPLPTGLSLSAAGIISGTPTVVGTFPITVKAADAFGDLATQSYSLKVSYPPLTVAAATLPVGYVGSNYTSPTLAATGGSGTGYSWTVTGGSALPAGLSLSTAGTISGKPTTAGTTSFSVTVTDSASNTGTGTFSITVNAAVGVTTGTTLPVGYVGSNYSQTLAATGGSGTGYTWAVAGGSALPTGLSLSSAGVLSGKPTTAGTPSFSITVTDSASNTSTATFSITINAGVTITTASTLPAGYQGTAYPGATMAATGGTGSGYTWTWTAAGGSSVPAGLGLSTAGVISGTPTASGTFSIVITVTDSASNTASATFSLTVQPTLSVATTTLPSGTVGLAYSQALAATGGSGTGYTWSINSAGTASLSSIGLSLSSAGVVSGASPTAGTANFTAAVTDSASHTATATLSVTVYTALTVTTTSLPATNAGTAYSQTLAAAGGTGTGFTWSVTAGASSLAAVNLGISSSGAITGTPSAAGTATFTVQVKDSGNNTATGTLTIQVYSALSLPAPSSTEPGPGTTGGGYTGVIAATGGSGSYSWTITGLPADGLSATTVGGTLTITGTPTSAATVSFTAKVTDTNTGVSAGPNTYSAVVSNPPPLVLPAPNPSSLPAATVNQSYSGSISATGGAGPYTWKINGTTVTGAPLAISNGLSATSTGSSTLTISGTPTATATVTLTSVTVTDNASTTAGPDTYSVTVNSAGSQVSGQINLSNNCGGGGTAPAITVSINTSPVQTTTTDNSGNYSFASIPNGTYTITPSISGPSSVFYPATQSITVNNAAITGEHFQVALGYTVSGTVSYSGSKTGKIYLALNSTTCGNSNSTGTALSAPGSFTIRGVPPGSYTLAAGMDTPGFGAQNANDPSGAASVTVGTANVTGAAVTMADPAAVSLSTGPKLKSASPFSGGAILNFKPITDSNGVEMATSYTVQWSTSASFSSVAGSKTFAATGTGGADIWILSGLTNGAAYYFRAAGTAGSSTSGWSSTVGPITIGAPASGNTVSGTVTFTGTPTGPLYVGFYDQNTNSVYVDAIASPSSPQAYTVQVPTGSNYFFFGIIDQNNNGLVDAGDITNTSDNNSSAVSISANTTENLTLPSANSRATVTTQHWQQTNSGGTATGYSLGLVVRQAIKMPVAVTLVSGPNVLNPVDIAACSYCGTPQFDYYVSINSDTPTVGDAYSFLVTYSDGSSETLTATVSAVLNAFATNLAPQGTSSTSTTPTFTWTDPASASSYIYQFYLWDNSGNTIWQIPGNNSNANGFDSTVTSITWGADPTGSGSTPTVGSLTSGATYNWQISVQDSNGNSAQTQVNYLP